MPKNGGKGQAVRAGIGLATGDYLIIQDADLEYDPQDYVPMLARLFEGDAQIVYGSRYLGRGRYPNQSLAAYVGGRSLSLITVALTGQYLTDTVTALKLFERARYRRPGARDERLRARSRDHRADGRARAADRRGPDSLLSADAGGRQEDRRARLVHRRENAVAVPPRLNHWTR